LRTVRKAVARSSGELVKYPPPYIAATVHHAVLAALSQNIPYH
jgi:hypothetical protein